MSTFKIDRFIFVFFQCWLIVDSFNGYFLMSGATISISQVFKSFVTILVLLRCLKYAAIERSICWILIYLSLYFLNLLYSGGELGASFLTINKFLTSFLFFLYFQQIKKVNVFFLLKNGSKVFKLSFIVLVFNMILGFFGFGYSTYGDGEDNAFGNKGYFYAANELSGVIATLFPWAFFYFKKTYPKIIFITSSLFLIFLAYGLGTKSGMVVAFSSFVIINYLYGNKREKMLMISLSLLFFVASVVYIQTLLESELPIMQRLSFFIEKEGLLNALTSGRLIYWDEKSHVFYNAGFISQLLGIGVDRSGRGVEMDPLDVLIYCGIIGLLFLFFIYFMMLVSPLKKKYESLPYNKVIFCSNLFLVAISIGGGHIVFSSMAGMFIALSNAMLFDKRTWNSITI